MSWWTVAGLLTLAVLALIAVGWAPMRRRRRELTEDRERWARRRAEIELDRAARRSPPDNPSNITGRKKR